MTESRRDIEELTFLINTLKHKKNSYKLIIKFGIIFIKIDAGTATSNSAIWVKISTKT